MRISDEQGKGVRNQLLSSQASAWGLTPGMELTASSVRSAPAFGSR
jgi:hypothetical protein